MLVIPAIDIIEGACVRLTRGDFGTKKIYDNDPLRVAEKWKDLGAGWLHVIDLDGAKTGRVVNLEIAVKIKKNLDLKIEYGGGIRNSESLGEVLISGIDRAILGTKAIEDLDFLKKSISVYGEKIILSLDYKNDGMVYKNGWTSKSSLCISDLIEEIKILGMRQIIITDISRDGTLDGLNYDFVKELVSGSGINFIIAGGIAKLDDIKTLKKMEKIGVAGVIVGKALYESKGFDLKKAIEIGKNK